MINLQNFDKKHKELMKQEEYGSFSIIIDDRPVKIYTFVSGNGYDGIDLLKLQDTINKKSITAKNDRELASITLDSITEMFKMKFPFTVFNKKMETITDEWKLKSKEYKNDVYNSLFALTEDADTEFFGIVDNVFEKINKIKKATDLSKK
jgi:hypothetical protein